MATAISFIGPKAGNATATSSTIYTAGSIPANTLSTAAITLGVVNGPHVLHGLYITPASASAGEITVLTLKNYDPVTPAEGSVINEFINTGAGKTIKFNQATTFYLPINMYIDVNTILKIQTSSGSPTIDLSVHRGPVPV